MKRSKVQACPVCLDFLPLCLEIIRKWKCRGCRLYSYLCIRYDSDKFSIRRIFCDEFSAIQYIPLIPDATCLLSRPLYMMAISDTKWRRLIFFYRRMSICVEK